jgi:urea ABC transporter ATP-binding protein UrtE
MLLAVDNLSSGYADSRVLHSVSLEVGEGEAVCILGRNGVGKTTLVKSIMGLLRASAGSITFAGNEITRRPTHEIARAGIAYVPQGREIFGRLTVEENLILGISDKREVFARVYEMFPILEKRRTQRAGTMSGGEQQQLAIGRALVSNPRLVILDEPSEGIQLSTVLALREMLTRLREDLGIAILLVEQDLEFALDVAQRGYVMEKGEIVSAGSREDLRHSEVVELYLTI